MTRKAKRLEIADFPVKDVRIDRQTRYQAGMLELSANELSSMALQDSRIEAASIEVVVPGEKTRIYDIRDAVEPRVKVSGPGVVFPGILGPIEPVGEGKNHRLSGVRVIVSADYKEAVRPGQQYDQRAVLDMWGPGAEASEYSREPAVVLVLRLAPGLHQLDAHAAIQQAEYRVARRLAETTVGLVPQRTEVFELAEDIPLLPRVVLIQGVITFAQDPHGGVSYYGMPLRESLNTLLHPNELLDGVLTPYTLRATGHWPRTYDWMNHPIVLQLYNEHGRRFNWVGIILQRIRFENQTGKEVTARNATEVAELLRVDGAILARIGGGNAFMDVMLTVQGLERRGIKTVLVSYEQSGPNGTELPFLFSVPEADAIVSTGNTSVPLELPAPERTVGASDMIQIGTVVPFSPRSPLSVSRTEDYLGGADTLGADHRTTKLY